MKNLRTFGAACALALAFTVPALAGHIEIGAAPPPPPPATTAGTASADGHMEIGFTSTDTVTETALTLIQVVFSLP